LRPEKSKLIRSESKSGNPAAKQKKMYLTSEVKKKIFKKNGGTEKNTGSAESQIALFTHRIEHLTAHLQTRKKDFNTQRALLNLVGKRRALLDYLKKIDISRYRAIIKSLEIRK
jgi:small subunit ribosomal protein S15